MNVPQLRFKEFSGEWDVKTLDVLATVERGKFSVRPRNDPKYFGGSIPFVQTGDVVASGLYLKQFSQTLNEEGLKVSKLFPKNTILITIAANIGDTTITSFDVACTDSVVAIQPFDNIANPVWLKFSLDLKNEELDSKATQNAQKNINLQILKPLLINTPTLPEQTKIANFLTTIDERINQLTHKKELMTQYKQGVMQQIFSQQLRFKDDNGEDFADWEEKTLSDISVKKSSNIAANKIENNEGHYKIYGASGVLKKIDFFTQNQAYISIIKDGAGVGRVFLCEPMTSVLGTMDIIQPKENIDILFLYAILQQIDFAIYVTGSTIPHIYYKNYAKERINVPSLPEQTKIANFLTALDEKIQQISQQIEATKQYKQGLLQQMFV